jgi:hypothetical protein
MKLAACITAFNGLELLEQCLINFEKSCDELIVCWQEVSHKGRRDTSVERIVKEITGSFPLPVTLVKYNPVIERGVKENERKKHNQMIVAARELGCTHFIMGATDHFYKSHEVDWAKQIVEKFDYDVTFTSMYTYYKHPTWRLTPIEDYHMPFICKITPETRIEKTSTYPVYVDPSVKVTPINNYYHFREFEVMLHHYSMIRADLKENKFKDAVSPVWRPGLMEQYITEFNNYDIEKNPGVSYFKGRKIEVVENYFNITV